MLTFSKVDASRRDPVEQDICPPPLSLTTLFTDETAFKIKKNSYRTGIFEALSTSVCENKTKGYEERWCLLTKGGAGTRLAHMQVRFHTVSQIAYCSVTGHAAAAGEVAQREGMPKASLQHLQPPLACNPCSPSGNPDIRRITPTARQASELRAHHARLRSESLPQRDTSCAAARFHA